MSSLRINVFLGYEYCIIKKIIKIVLTNNAIVHYSEYNKLKELVKLQILYYISLYIKGIALHKIHKMLTKQKSPPVLSYYHQQAYKFF